MGILKIPDKEINKNLFRQNIFTHSHSGRGCQSPSFSSPCRCVTFGYIIKFVCRIKIGFRQNIPYQNTVFALDAVKNAGASDIERLFIQSLADRSARMNNGKLLGAIAGLLDKRRLKRMEYHAQRGR